jgi:hypothetical protein
MTAYKDVTIKESIAYSKMKGVLGFTTDASLLNFIKVKTLENFNPSNLMVGV